MTLQRIIKGLDVELKYGDERDFERSLRKFKRNIKEAGILDEVRERSTYKSKGKKRREAKKAAIRRNKRAVKKEQDSRSKKY